MKHEKILAICSLGQRKSKFISGYQKEKRFETKYGRIDENATKKLNPKNIEETDLVIFTQKKYKNRFESQLRKIKRDYIILKVKDSGIDVQEEKKYLLDSPLGRFYEEWVNLQLINKLEGKI